MYLFMSNFDALDNRKFLKILFFIEVIFLIKSKQIWILQEDNAFL